MDSSWGHDLRWLFVSGGSRRADRLGAGWLGGASVGSARFEAGGGARHLAQAQEETPNAGIAATLPRSTRDVGAYISQAFGVVYESCIGSSLCCIGSASSIASRKRSDASSTQKAAGVYEAYDKLLNSLAPDEAVLFVDAAHPTHATRPVGCWKRSRRCIRCSR